MSRPVREVHAAAGGLINEAVQCSAALDSLGVDTQRLADHRALLKSATDKLTEARRLAVETDHDHSQDAEDLVTEANKILHSERVFIGQQRLAASGNYGPL